MAHTPLVEAALAADGGVSEVSYIKFAKAAAIAAAVAAATTSTTMPTTAAAAITVYCCASKIAC